MPGLPPLWNLLLSLVAGVLGVWSGLRANRRETVSDATHVLKHSPHLWLVPGLPLLLLIVHLLFVLQPEWEWSLPYAAQYYYGALAWGIVIGCFTYFTGFGGAVFLKMHHPQRLQLGAVMFLLLIALQLFHRQSTDRMVPETGEAVTTPEGYTHQTSTATCVPAATATLMAVLGEKRTESELVELLGTDVNGTLPCQLVMAMRRLGYRESTFNLDRDDLEAVRAPAVVFLRGNTHSVTLLHVGERTVEVWNPQPPVVGGSPGGRLRIDRSAVRRYFAGAHAIGFERASPER